MQGEETSYEGGKECFEMSIQLEYMIRHGSNLRHFLPSPFRKCK